MDKSRHLRIGLIAPPVLPVPPTGYAGTERVVATLATTLHARGHDVTVFASGDSHVPCELVPVIPTALWTSGHRGDLSTYTELAVIRAWEEQHRFDILHSHVETAGFAMARYARTPVVTTLHRRLDDEGVAALIARCREIPLIAVSDSQRRWHPSANWVSTIHHGLDFGATPISDRAGEYLLLVGRVAREKGVAEAIEVARRSRLPLVMAAKVREAEELALFDRVVRPAIDAGVVDWRGEVGGPQRDELMAGALATMMLGGWPEPFGLVAIESMATGTPVIARRAGGVTETVEHGVSGFLVDDIDEALLAVSRVHRLDRARISALTRRRFTSERMAMAYEQAYGDVIDARSARTPVVERVPVRSDGTDGVASRVGLHHPRRSERRPSSRWKLSRPDDQGALPRNRRGRRST